MNKILDAMALVSELNKTHGVKQRGGKMYTQVVHRMEAFRTVFGTEFGLDTKVLVDDGERVVVKAVITNAGYCIGSGHAEELRGQGHVNTTSALENAETSAIGRALASIGLSGGEFASANEMEAVPRKQTVIDNREAPPQNQTAGAVVSPPLSTAPPSEPSTQDPHKAQDKEYFAQLIAELSKKQGRAAVEHLFVQNKPKIKEISERNKERGDKFLDLFINRLSELEGVE